MFISEKEKTLLVFLLNVRMCLSRVGVYRTGERCVTCYSAITFVAPPPWRHDQDKAPHWRTGFRYRAHDRAGFTYRAYDRRAGFTYRAHDRRAGFTYRAHDCCLYGNKVVDVSPWRQPLSVRGGSSRQHVSS